MKIYRICKSNKGSYAIQQYIGVILFTLEIGYWKIISKWSSMEGAKQAYKQYLYPIQEEWNPISILEGGLKL